MTAAISAGNVPVHGSSASAENEAAGSPASAAKFEEALAQAPVNPVGVSGAESLSQAIRANTNFPFSAHALTAADDAWVEFLATSERLQNPQLAPEEKSHLLRGLTESLRSFQSQSEPIMRELEDYVAREATSKF